MKLCKSGSMLALLGLCLVGMTGCAEDNERFIKEQASRAKGTIPGSRTAQAQTLDEYYEITPGLQGAGMRTGPRPDQGKGYPDARSATAANSMWRMAMPGPDPGAGRSVAKKPAATTTPGGTSTR